MRQTSVTGILDIVGKYSQSENANCSGGEGT